jgi:SAM-dependent methyltransferase
VPEPTERAEIDRIRRVYGHYGADPGTAARWDDDRPGNAEMLAERQRVFDELLAGAGLTPRPDRRLVEVGCGGGGLVARFGGRRVGVDLLEDRLRTAAAVAPGVPLVVANGEHLPLRDGTADVVVMATVLSSILDDGVARRVAAEARRVLAPRGAVLVYDLRVGNPRNPNVRPVGRARLAALFPGARVRWQPVTVLPPLARRLGRLAPRAYPLLARIPFLRTHGVALIRP